jgi:hypothetical protein
VSKRKLPTQRLAERTASTDAGASIPGPSPKQKDAITIRKMVDDSKKNLAEMKSRRLAEKKRDGTP